MKATQNDNGWPSMASESQSADHSFEFQFQMKETFTCLGGWVIGLSHLQNTYPLKQTLISVCPETLTINDMDSFSGTIWVWANWGSAEEHRRFEYP